MSYRSQLLLRLQKAQFIQTCQMTFKRPRGFLCAIHCCLSKCSLKGAFWKHFYDSLSLWGLSFLCLTTWWGPWHSIFVVEVRLFCCCYTYQVDLCGLPTNLVLSQADIQLTYLYTGVAVISYMHWHPFFLVTTCAILVVIIFNIISGHGALWFTGYQQRFLYNRNSIIIVYTLSPVINSCKMLSLSTPRFWCIHWNRKPIITATFSTNLPSLQSH